MMADLFTCSHCNQFSALKMSSVLRHIGRVHSHDPGFHMVCGINDCPRTFRKYYSFRKHLHRSHPDVFKDNIRVSNPVEVEENYHEFEGEAESSIENETDKRLRSSALFLLKAKEIDRINQSSLESLMNDITVIVEQTLDEVEARSTFLTDDARKELSEIVNDPTLRNPFLSLHSEYLQKNQYKNLFGLVEPIERQLGSSLKRRVKKGKRKLQLCAEYAYDIPLLQSLQQLLSNDFVYDEIMRGHQRNDDKLEDLCDGTAYKEHPLFSKDETALQIMLYYDDLEVANPIGSRSTKHKLGVFYFLLGNISPRFRSSLNTIQLLTVVKQSYIKQYGIDKILEPFMKDIGALESDDGVSFVVNGLTQNFRGTISVVSADNLAAWDLGGYIQLASALRKCRFCMAVREDMVSKFYSEDFLPRTVETYKEHCSDLNGPLHDHVVTTYGIRRDSILNQSRYFHVVNALAPDIMHDILEGCLMYEMKELLIHYVSNKKLLTLDELNSRIDTFPFSYLDARNKPSLIKSLGTTDHALKQSASQMWCLAVLLPLIIGELVDSQDVHWECFCLLLTITNYAFAPVTTEDAAMFLKEKINEHHQLFGEIYPDSPIIPKHHYVVHLPEWMIMYGPPVRYWCMRFEAKHAYFKSLAHRIKNFKNIPKSLASRHQHKMCYVLSTGKNFCLKETNCGKIKEKTQLKDYEHKDDLLSVTNYIQDHTVISSVSWAEIGGTMYKPGAFIVLADNILPKFYEIIDIVIFNVEQCVFFCKQYVTNCFIAHFNSYEILESQSCPIFCSYNDLLDYHPLSAYRLSSYPNSKFIPVKYHFVETC